MIGLGLLIKPAAVPILDLPQIKTFEHFTLGRIAFVNHALLRRQFIWPADIFASPATRTLGRMAQTWHCRGCIAR